MSTIKANQWLNPDGTENYKCRAWANYNGITNSLRGAGNVISVVDQGPGDFIFNLNSSIEDLNYCVIATCSQSSSAASSNLSIGTKAPTVNAQSFESRTTSSIRIQVNSGGGAEIDCDDISIAIFR